MHFNKSFNFSEVGDNRSEIHLFCNVLWRHLLFEIYTRFHMFEIYCFVRIFYWRLVFYFSNTLQKTHAANMLHFSILNRINRMRLQNPTPINEVWIEEAFRVFNLLFSSDNACLKLKIQQLCFSRFVNSFSPLAIFRKDVRFRSFNYLFVYWYCQIHYKKC